MARIRLQRPQLSEVRAAVGENLRKSDAMILEKWTRIVRWCLLGCAVSAMIGFPLGAIAAMLGSCYGLYRMRDAARGFAGAAWLGALAAVLAASMLWPNNGVWPVFSAASAALMVVACYSLFRSLDAQRKIPKVTGLVVAGMVLTASMQGKNDDVSLLVRGLGVAIVLVALVKRKCIAYASCMDGFDEALAQKWRGQWGIFQATVYSAAGLFVVSAVFEHEILWLLSLLGGGAMLAALAIRDWVLMGRTIRVCRTYLRLKLVVDSVPC